MLAAGSAAGSSFVYNSGVGVITGSWNRCCISYMLAKLAYFNFFARSVAGWLFGDRPGVLVVADSGCGGGSNRYISGTGSIYKQIIGFAGLQLP